MAQNEIVAYVEEYGNQLRVVLSTGESVLAVPTGQGMWIASAALYPPLPDPGTPPDDPDPDPEGWVWPLSKDDGWVVTSEFGYRNHPGGGYKMHYGIDIAGSGVNGTPFVAPYDGTVYANNYTSGTGNRLVLKHERNFYTEFFHMIEPSPLSVGATVTTGQVVGRVGNTGASFGAHLHFQTHIGGPSDAYAVNPRTFMADRGTPW